jgi:hypothetical protein
MMAWTVVLALVVVAGALIAAVLSYLLHSRREDTRRAESERRAQVQRQLTASQPGVIATGAQFGIRGNTVPQWLDDKNGQLVELNNASASLSSEVHGVLFGAPAFHVKLSIANSPVIYWDGKLDAPLPPGAQVPLFMYKLEFPLQGDESIIPGYTLLPQNTASAGTPGHHYYFARLTLTFRDASARTLAAVFDWESAVINNSLTQTVITVAGPIEVKHSLRDLMDEAVQRWTGPAVSPPQ